jgi:hypothetical protein
LQPEAASTPDEELSYDLSKVRAKNGFRATETSGLFLGSILVFLMAEKRRARVSTNGRRWQGVQESPLVSSCHLVVSNIIFA